METYVTVVAIHAEIRYDNGTQKRLQPTCPSSPALSGLSRPLLRLPWKRGAGRFSSLLCVPPSPCLPTRACMVLTPTLLAGSKNGNLVALQPFESKSDVFSV
jgi:hypothetical protein